jgi:branched-chain amino acid transport system ATP-binding protein
MTEPLLSLQAVRAGYGDALVLHDISLDLPEHGSLAVLGRNGVGKTTLLLTIMGYTQMRGGRIVWRGEDISRTPPNRRAAGGIGWVAQERDIFPSLSVEENLTVAARPGAWTLDTVFKMFPRLAERRGNMGNQLSGGEQQMLSIARALLTNPKILLMDEPTEGLAPVLVDTLIDVLAKLRAESALSIILVEQNSRVAFAFSPRTVILDKGRIVYDGYSEPLRADAERLAKLIGIVE